jgi:hypothetical protein
LALLPAMLGCCVAAAGFCFDEPAPALAAVTPRGGGWRLSTRLAAAAVPLALWVLLVLLRPGGLELTRRGWWFAGLCATFLVVGLAAVAARREVAAPGTSLAAAVTLGVFTPVVIGMFLGWQSVYPVEEFPRGVLVFWSAVGIAGAATCAAALRTVPPR